MELTLQFKDVLIALFTVFLWSLNIVFQKVTCQKFCPDFFNFARLLCCAPLLLFFYKSPPQKMVSLFFIALFWYVINYFFIGLSLQTGTGVGVISVLYQTCAFFGVLFCFLFNKEIPKTHQILGMIISFIGVNFLFEESFIHHTNNIGMFYILFAALSWGIGIALIKRYDLTMDLSTNVWLATISVIPMGLILWVKDGNELIQASLQAISLEIFMSILFAAFAAVLLAGYLWFALLKKYPAFLVTPFILLFSPCTCFISYFFLEERFNLLQILSFLIIFVGISINQNVLVKLVRYRRFFSWKRWISTN